MVSRQASASLSLSRPIGLSDVKRRASEGVGIPLTNAWATTKSRCSDRLLRCPRGAVGGIGPDCFLALEMIL